MADRNNGIGWYGRCGSRSEHGPDVRLDVRTDNHRNSARYGHLARYDNAWVHADAGNHAAGYCHPNTWNSNSDTRKRNSGDHNSKYGYTGNDPD
jgi:hypothetical protein